MTMIRPGPDKRPLLPSVVARSSAVFAGAGIDGRRSLRARGQGRSHAASLPDGLRDIQGIYAGRGVSALPASPEAVAAFLSTRGEPADQGRHNCPPTCRYPARAQACRPANAKQQRTGAFRDEGHLAFARNSAGQEISHHAARLIAIAPLPGERLSSLPDRALLSFGFAYAFRRSELAALDCEDVENTLEGHDPARQNREGTPTWRRPMWPTRSGLIPDARAGWQGNDNSTAA